MAIICPICTYDNQENSSGICLQCGFDLNSGSSLYEKPLQDINKAAETILAAEGSAAPEEITALYSEIAASSAGLIGQAKAELEKGLASLKNNSASISAADNNNTELINNALANFEKAAGEASKNLESIYQALYIMNDPEKTKEGQAQLEFLSTAIQQNFLLLQQSSMAFMTFNQDAEYPIDITNVSKILEYISAYISSYLKTKSVQELKSAVYYIESAKRTLISQIEEYEGVPYDQEISETNFVDNEGQSEHSHKNIEETDDDEEYYDDEEYEDEEELSDEFGLEERQDESSDIKIDQYSPQTDSLALGNSIHSENSSEDITESAHETYGGFSEKI